MKRVSCEDCYRGKIMRSFCASEKSTHQVFSFVGEEKNEVKPVKGKRLSSHDLKKLEKNEVIGIHFLTIKTKQGEEFVVPGSMYYGYIHIYKTNLEEANEYQLEKKRNYDLGLSNDNSFLEKEVIEPWGFDLHDLVEGKYGVFERSHDFFISEGKEDIFDLDYGQVLYIQDLLTVNRDIESFIDQFHWLKRYSHLPILLIENKKDNIKVKGVYYQGRFESLSASAGGENTKFSPLVLATSV